jgi:hypothetical protein
VDDAAGRRRCIAGYQGACHRCTLPAAYMCQYQLCAACRAFAGATLRPVILALLHATSEHCRRTAGHCNNCMQAHTCGRSAAGLPHRGHAPRLTPAAGGAAGGRQCSRAACRRRGVQPALGGGALSLDAGPIHPQNVTRVGSAYSCALGVQRQPFISRLLPSLLLLERHAHWPTFCLPGSIHTMAELRGYVE